MKIDKIKKVIVVTYYDSDDEDFGGDYNKVDIYIDGKKIISYGDAYHDNGEEKAEGALDMLKAFPEFKGKIIYKNKNEEL